MRIILDTNILVAALIRNSITRKILLHPELEFLVSEFIFEEVEKHHEEICHKSGLDANSFMLLLDLLKERFVFVPDEEIKHKPDAKKIMEHIDVKDSIFIALALSTDNEGIWSEDKHFEKQKTVRIWKTQELASRLNII